MPPPRAAGLHIGSFVHTLKPERVLGLNVLLIAAPTAFRPLRTGQPILADPDPGAAHGRMGWSI
jgi:hypothetical protein